MRNCKQQKGTILVATYLVLFVIAVVASSFFAYSVNERKHVEREVEGMRALNYAEKGLAYAYHEAYNLGWDWHTHRWDSGMTNLEPLAATDRLKIRDDCTFDAATGFYVHNSGQFMIKAYPDKIRENDTIVVSMGIHGNERRVLMYYLTRRGIYDFFLYTPYDLNLYSAVGRAPDLNGGGIHSNGDIYLRSAQRLADISELSTGEDGNIYYTNSQYLAPYYADRIDGTMDGKSPITRLDQIDNIWRDDRVPQAGPFGAYNSRGQWYWKSGANYFVAQSKNSWPTNSFLNSEYHFAGDAQSVHDIAPGQKDYYTSYKNDSSDPLNRENVWIKLFQLDDEGNQIDTDWTQIPSELNQPWAWDKYRGHAYGTGYATDEQPVEFYTYDDSGSKLNVEDSLWEIDSGAVKMLTPPADPADLPDFYAAHPNAQGYWDMFRSPDFWNIVRGDPAWAARLNQEAVMDGDYGDERLNNDILMVDHLNSKNQPDAWKQFLVDSGLDGYVRDGNTGGEYLEPPDFSSSYSRLAQKDGLYMGLVDATHEANYGWQSSIDYDTWQKSLEDSIDHWANVLNKGDSDNGVAKKVKFINTFTGEWNTVLEIDLEKMQEHATYPKNGILYTKVPIRITNAKELARAKPKYGFTILAEENVYLKGDFNTDEWVTSAVISKKRIVTLSDDFNDPQFKPATEHYRDYPYMYVKRDPATNEYVECSHSDPDGTWVYYNYLDSDGAQDRIDYYPGLSDANEASLRADILAKDAAYRNIFKHDDPSGQATGTFSWAVSGEKYTYGMMANRVMQNHEYNCLMASRRWLDGSHKNRGDVLENWRYYDDDKNRWVYNRRIFNGAYFVLENEGFTAPNSEFVDYTGKLPYDNRGRESASTTYSRALYLTSYYASTSMSYDANFKTATRAPSDVFFGGAESLWAEATEDFFYQTKF